ncbi:MAG TPA: hypothetical protein VNL95_00445 [Dehalococcoidia bacterium]|nr:hypothetical protein [Dehalococcoidia bacterium]
MDKVLVTVLLVVAGIVSASIVANTVLPAVQRAGGDVVSVSGAVSDRIRTDARIIETAAAAGSQTVQVWVKNVGSITIANLERMDVFFGPVGNFQRVPPCAQTGNVPPCWEISIENDTRWSPYATARVDIELDAGLTTGQDYIVTVVLPNGVPISTTFSV